MYGDCDREVDADGLSVKGGGLVAPRRDGLNDGRIEGRKRRGDLRGAKEMHVVDDAAAVNDGFENEERTGEAMARCVGILWLDAREFDGISDVAADACD